ncbi:MAG TPA: DUF4153 domain-containing protein [Candidatus Saccharimonadales bacterium]|nr:DUF4153 domain-containing protein [Candidatus Saccharimonadales bacterium]
MKKFKEKLVTKIPALSVIISIIVAWMIAPTADFPIVAFFVFFVSLASVIYFVRKAVTRFDTTLYVGILLLSCFILYRANGALQFLDFVFIIFFGSLLIRPLMSEYGVFTIIMSPFIVIKNIITSKNIFPYSFGVAKKYAKANSVLRYVPTIAVTALVLLCTIPLLASANPFFNALLQNVLNFFNLTWLFQYLFTDPLIVYILRVFALAALLYVIPRTLSISVVGTEKYVAKSWLSINYLIPKIAMALVLIIFFITQIQLYFASAHTLQSLGYTNSRLTNEVFAQVTIVAFIVFLLAYLDKSREVWNQRLTYFLVIEAYFLVGIAFKSVNDYSSLYGLTQKRLWGYTTMTWLTCALAVFVYYYKKQTSDLSFVKQIMTLTMAVLLVVNILNFDYLIYHYSKPTTPKGVDYRYLAGLSPDAHQSKEVIIKAMEEAEKKASSNTYDSQNIDAVYKVIDEIGFLRYKYGAEKSANSFNFSEYQEYLDTKNINVDSYLKKISILKKKFHQE